MIVSLLCSAFLSVQEPKVAQTPSLDWAFQSDRVLFDKPARLEGLAVQMDSGLPKFVLTQEGMQVLLQYLEGDGALKQVIWSDESDSEYAWWKGGNRLAIRDPRWDAHLRTDSATMTIFSPGGMTVSFDSLFSLGIDCGGYVKSRFGASKPKIIKDEKNSYQQFSNPKKDIMVMVWKKPKEGGFDRLILQSASKRLTLTQRIEMGSPKKESPYSHIVLEGSLDSKGEALFVIARGVHRKAPKVPDLKHLFEIANKSRRHGISVSDYRATPPIDYRIEDYSEVPTDITSKLDQ